MATNFPTSVDAFTNPTANDSLNTPSHSTQHADINDAVEAVESYLIATDGIAPKGVVNYSRNTTATLTLTSTTETSFMTSASWTPIAGRLYAITIDIGYVQKTTSVGNIDIRLRKDNTSGTILYQTLYSAQPIASVWQHSKTILATTTQLGTTAFVPTVTVQVNNVGGCVVKNDTVAIGTILIQDVGLA